MTQTAGADTFPCATTARAWVQTLFPAGEYLAPADPDKILGDIGGAMGKGAAARRMLAAGMWVVNGLALVCTLQPFARLDPARRAMWVGRWSRWPLVRDLLRLVALPYRAAYALDPDRKRAVGAEHRVQVPTRIEPERWRTQVIDAASAEAQTDMEADVVVIGSGAGGAVAADELASAGLAVVMVEEGRYWDRRHFNGDTLAISRTMYRAGGVTGTVGNTFVMVPLGRTVGGTTAINSGTCFRTPDAVLRQWQKEGLTELNRAVLDPYFAEVEAVLEVQRATPATVGPIGDIIRRGAAAVGLRDVHELLRNAPACDGQALCQFGCPTDAKRSTNVSFVPRALRRGAVLLTRYRATRLLREGARVAGIEAIGSEGEVRDRRLIIRSRAVVVSMGTMLTPTFLLRNGVTNRWLGRNLSVHPCGGVSAWFPGVDMRNTRSIPQGLGIGDWADRGIRFEGGTPPLSAYALGLPQHGLPFVQDIERYRETAFFGFMIRDHGRGRVLATRGPRPLALYSIGRRDMALYAEAMTALVNIFRAAGAKEVAPIGCLPQPRITTDAEARSFARRRWGPRDFIVTAYHPLGTARLSATPDRGVIGPDHAVWGHEGLYVMDGSAVPSSLGVNPQVTIMALALRAARLLAQRLQ